MKTTSAAFSALALVGVAHSAPLAPGPVSLPASQSVQEAIINLENTIVYITNDIVQTNAANGKNDYTTAQSQFAGIADSIVPSACPPQIYEGQITTATGAITALNSTQNELAQLSLDLQNAANTQQTISTDFCNANGTFTIVQNYIFNILGTPENGAANEPVAASLNAQSYDPNKLGSTEIAAEVALEALISALNNIAAGQPSSDQAKTAFTNAENSLDTFSQAADAAAPHSCPAFTLTGATDSKGAIDDVYVVEKAVQTAYADTTADNGQKLVDFCMISEYMTGVNDYVKA